MIFRVNVKKISNIAKVFIKYYDDGYTNSKEKFYDLSEGENYIKTDSRLIMDITINCGVNSSYYILLNDCSLTKGDNCYVE